MLSFWDQVLITSAAVLGAAVGSSLLSIIHKCLAVPTRNKPVQSTVRPRCAYSTMLTLGVPPTHMLPPPSNSGY